MAQLMKCCKRRLLIEEMLPGGWNSQIETNKTEHYPIPFQTALEKKEMIPGGWISQRKAEKEMFPEASTNQQDSGSVEGPATKP